MIIPSIDIMGGQAVQLVGGREKVLEAGDPLPIAKRFSPIGEIAVIDLDQALGQGSNHEIIEQLLPIARCRVGGGIRDTAHAFRLLDCGAEKLILGTRAVPEFLKALPRERIIAAVDAYRGEVVVDGWRTKTGKGIVEVMKGLQGYVSGFLVTFVEYEGLLQGTNLSAVENIVRAANGVKVTVAGGISSSEEIAELDRLGVDAQVGMALYTDRISLAKAFSAPIKCDRADGLWPTVVCNERGVALGLAWSNLESLTQALETRQGIYFSRKTGNVWRKGEQSGARQDLLKVDLDCDRDALRFTVRQYGEGFCHRDTMTCWGRGPIEEELFTTIKERLSYAPSGSYTKRLFEERGLLEAKLLEEAREVIEAQTQCESIEELTDLLYFMLVRAVQKDVSLQDIGQTLTQRALRVSRRSGNTKIMA